MNLPAPSGEATRLLQAWHAGWPEALDQLMPLVYDELRRLARDYLRRERADHTLQPTALVHEAYLRLVGTDSIPWEGRAHFYGIAARTMRQILVQHARARQAAKRGGKPEYIDLHTVEVAASQAPIDLVELDDLLRLFAHTYPRKAEVVELKFFGGLEAREIAAVLQTSEKTVLRDWSFAKLWLHEKLAPGAG